MTSGRYIALLSLAVMLLFSFANNSSAQDIAPGNITPTLYCLGSCPVSVTPTPTPSNNPTSNVTISSALSQLPATPSSQPSVSKTVPVKPAPTLAPCSPTQQNTTSSTHSLGKHRGKHHRAIQGGFLQFFMQFLLQLLQLIFQHLGILLSGVTPCAPSLSPFPVPSSAIPSVNPGGGSGGGTLVTPSSIPAGSPFPTIFGTSPSPSVAAPSPTSSTSTMQPVGISGNWSLVFDDEFNGSSLNRNNWAPVADGGEAMENNVAVSASNVSVSGGNLILTLSSSSLGANVTSDPNEVGGGHGFQFGDGYFLEGRIYFPGASVTNLYNWPAFWTSGHNWPATGEIDIAEVGNGPLTTSYHCSNGSGSDCGTATPGGSWGNAWHIYGVDREPGKATIYWDGKAVKTFTTSDGGAAEYFLINVGNSTGSQCNCGGPSVYGTGSQVKIDYVRAWKKN